MTNKNKDYQKLKVLFVDWHKTLCSLPLFHELQDGNEELFDKLDRRLFEDMPIALFIEWMRGKFTKSDVVNLLAGEDLSIEFVHRILKSSCEKMFFDREEFWPLIAKVRKGGRKVVIATDNIDTFCEYTVPALRLDQYFDDIICSFNIKCLKKDVKNGKMLFFEDYLQKNSVGYDEAILLDDSIETVNACHKCGMQAELINSPDDVIRILNAVGKCDE